MARISHAFVALMLLSAFESAAFAAPPTGREEIAAPVECKKVPGELKKASTERERREVTIKLKKAISVGTLVTAQNKKDQKTGEEDRREIPGVLFYPKKASDKPRKAIVALHGCDGLWEKKDSKKLKQRYDYWAYSLVQQGYVVFFPEDYEGRCEYGQKRVLTIDRAILAMKAAEWLADGKEHKYVAVDPERIALLGWSHGGQAVISAALNTDKRRSKARFTTMIAFYPGCSQFTSKEETETHKVYNADDWERKPGVQILIGSLDTWTPPEHCKDLVAKFASDKPGSERIRMVGPDDDGCYARAYHDFDGCEKRKTGSKGYYGGGPAEARAAAHVEAKTVFHDEFAKKRGPDEDDFDWKNLRGLLAMYDDAASAGIAVDGDVLVGEHDDEIFSEEVVRRERLNEVAYEEDQPLELQKRRRDELRKMRDVLAEELEMLERRPGAADHRRLDALDEQLDTLDRRLDELAQHFNGRLDRRLDRQLDELEKRLERERKRIERERRF